MARMIRAVTIILYLEDLYSEGGDDDINDDNLAGGVLQDTEWRTYWSLLSVK